MFWFTFASNSILAIALIVGGAETAHALRVKEQQVILDKIDDYKLCQTKDYTGEWCHDALVRWVEDHPDDAFKAGKATRLHMNHHNAIPFFTQAFDANKGDCKDEDVKLAVVSALNLPSGDEKIPQAKKIALESCYSDLKATLVKEATLDSYMFKNVCKDLVAKGAISGLKQKKCAALK